MSIGVMAAVQVLLVRYLSRTDYGAWTYALSVVVLLQSVAALGLDRSVTRFLAIYRERGDLARVRGLVCCSSARWPHWHACHARPRLVPRDDRAHHGCRRPRPRHPEHHHLPRAARGARSAVHRPLRLPRAGARHRHSTTHSRAGLKLAAVVALIMLHADVTYLAYGYLGASLIGMLLYAPMVMRSAKQLGLTGSGLRRDVTVPAKEVFAFTLPLLTADLAGAIMWSAGTLTLGYFSTLDQVALFTAVVPLATLNETVARNFTVLYTPAISRLYARQDHAAINTMYWRTAVWVAVLTFPVFVLTFSASGSLLHVLYGTKYRGRRTPAVARRARRIRQRRTRPEWPDAARAERREIQRHSQRRLGCCGHCGEHHPRAPSRSAWCGVRDVRDDAASLRAQADRTGARDRSQSLRVPPVTALCRHRAGSRSSSCWGSGACRDSRSCSWALRRRHRCCCSSRASAC